MVDAAICCCHYMYHHYHQHSLSSAFITTLYLPYALPTHSPPSLLVALVSVSVSAIVSVFWMYDVYRFRGTSPPPEEWRHLMHFQCQAPSRACLGRTGVKSSTTARSWRLYFHHCVRNIHNYYRSLHQYTPHWNSCSLYILGIIILAGRWYKSMSYDKRNVKILYFLSFLGVL